MSAPTSAGRTATVRPLQAVLAAVEQGCGSVDEISRATGLDRDPVRAALDHLRRMGRLEARELSMGCPGGGCGSCASGTAEGTAGCGAAGPSATRRGPVLVQLSVRR